MSKYIGRGGSYPNSGRKPVGAAKRIKTSFTIEPELLTKLDTLVAQGEGSRSDIINRLLRAMQRSHTNNTGKMKESYFVIKGLKDGIPVYKTKMRTRPNAWSPDPIGVKKYQSRKTAASSLKSEFVLFYSAGIESIEVEEIKYNT